MRLLEFTPDGSRAVCVLGARKVRVYDVRTGQAVSEHTVADPTVAAGADPHNAPTFAAITHAAASDAHFAVAHSSKTVDVYALAGAAEPRRIRTEKRVSGLRFAEGGAALVVCDKSGDVYRYALGALAAETPMLGHVSIVTGAAVAPDGAHVLSMDRDEKIRVSRYPAGHDIAHYLLGHTSFVSTMAFVGGSHLVSGGGDCFIALWDWTRGDEAQLRCTLDLRALVAAEERPSQWAVRQVLAVERTAYVIVDR